MSDPGTRPETGDGQTDGVRLLIVHPEGNLANNPNLTALVGLLAERGHAVTVLAPERRFARHPDPAVRMRLRPDPLQRVLSRAGRSDLLWPALRLLAAWPLAGRGERFDLVLGVDRQGLLEARAIARRLGVPHALLSYEIFFDAECPAGFKRLERRTAADAAFAIVQDEERARCLEAETGIPQARMVLMPVAGTGPGAERGTGERTGALAERLGLGPERRIAIHAGSLEDWTMIRETIAGLEAWPEDWALAVNERYGAPPAWLAEARERHPGRLFILPGGLGSTGALGALLAGADLGLAFYRPTFDTIYTGRNLAHIGLASGKFSTALQNGLPVAVNDLNAGETGGAMVRMVRDLGLGVVTDPGTLGQALAGLDLGSLPAMRAACTAAFAAHLDAANFVGAVEERIVAAVSGGHSGS